MKNTINLKGARFILFLAAIYNLLWGGIVSLFPSTLYFGNPSSAFLDILIRCIGMLVGVYGIAYYYASCNPLKYWPLVFVGFLGKFLGPLGSVYYIIKGDLTASFFLVNFFNDIIWLIPFGWILYLVYKENSIVKSTKQALSLYQTILKENFKDLSPNLQEFHRAREPIAVRGFFKVEWGLSLVNKFFARLSKLPPPSIQEEVELLVIPNNNYEEWNRRIGSNTVKSFQWISDDMLVEKFGIIKMFLTLEVVNGNLVIKDTFSSILGLPLPPFFTPTVIAKGKDNMDGVFIDVDISLVPFGRLIHYAGFVKVVELRLKQ